MSRMTSGAPGTFLSRVLRWGFAPATVAMALVGCGGGGGTADSTSTGVASAQMNGVAAFAMAQQSVSATQPATAAMAATDETAATPDNLVVDGSFDAPAGSYSPWAWWGSARRITGDSTSGMVSVRVGPGAGGVGQTIARIVPGNTYRLTVQAKVSAASETAYVGLNFVNAAGEPVTQNSVLVNSTSYTTATLDVAAPPNAAAAQVYVWKNAATGFAVVDDFSVQAIGQAPPGPEVQDNQVVNGGMEDGLQGWANWGNTVVSSADTPTGFMSAKVGPGAGGFGQEVGGILGGHSYRLSAQAKVSVPGEGGYLGIVFIDDAGNWLRAQNVVFASSTYQRMEANVTAPAAATRAIVFVWKNDGTGFASVDNVALFQVDQQAPTSPPAALPVVQMGQRTQTISDLVGFERSPSIARLSGGGYVTAWAFDSYATAAPEEACFVRLDSVGLRLGSTSCVQGSQVSASSPIYVFARPDGGFVIVWWAAANQAVQSQAYDAAGNPVGGIQAGPQRPVSAKAAALAGGGYVDVMVQPGGQSSAASMITFQRYASDGTPIGAPTSVGDSGGFQALPAIPLAGGGFAVTWLQLAAPSASVVMTRMFTADGTPVTAPMVASGTPPMCFSTGCEFQGLSAMTPIDDGGYVVLWFDGFGRGASNGTFARRFRPDGTPTPVLGKVDTLSLVGAAAPNDAGQFLLVHQQPRSDTIGGDVMVVRLLGANQLQ